MRWIYKTNLEHHCKTACGTTIVSSRLSCFHHRWKPKIVIENKMGIIAQPCCLLLQYFKESCESMSAEHLQVSVPSVRAAVIFCVSVCLSTDADSHFDSWWRDWTRDLHCCHEDLWGSRGECDEKLLMNLWVGVFVKLRFLPAGSDQMGGEECDGDKGARRQMDDSTWC